MDHPSSRRRVHQINGYDASFQYDDGPRAGAGSDRVGEGYLVDSGGSSHAYLEDESHYEPLDKETHYNANLYGENRLEIDDGNIDNNLGNNLEEEEDSVRRTHLQIQPTHINRRAFIQSILSSRRSVPAIFSTGATGNGETPERCAALSYQ